MALRSGIACRIRFEARRMHSAICTISGSKCVTLNRRMVLAVFCIWSMASSIDWIRREMSPRSKGVMKERLSASSTSRVMRSPSCSQSMTVLRFWATPAPPARAALSASAPATAAAACSAKSAKKRSSLGKIACNQRIAIPRLLAPGNSPRVLFGPALRRREAPRDEPHDRDDQDREDKPRRRDLVHAGAGRHPDRACHPEARRRGQAVDAAARDEDHAGPQETDRLGEALDRPGGSGVGPPLRGQLLEQLQG